MDTLVNRTRAAVWHPCTQMKQLEAAPPLAVTRGEGAWLIDTDGRRYLDAISSWWVNLFGHCNPRINAAITDQLGKIEHVMLAGATHEPVVALSERLANLTGLGHAFYGSDGASATEIALKMSAHYWRNAGRPEKNGFISLKNGYHGETLGALSVTDIPLFKDTYAPLLRHSVQVPTPDTRLAAAGEPAEAFALRCAAVLEAHLAEHAATTAAFIIEPLMQGAAGMAMYHPAYLTRARELCDHYQVHLIADEIAVGFGRTGTMFAFEQAPPLPLAESGIKAVRPDFICLSKGITGGYLPLSAVLTTDDIYAAFYDDATARG
ncbi:MAG TPA: aminotransferase class III-fold pyridoxal phosphate-dependent enzyme, partial [Thiobacillus sp.]|nr:aminotransferase class III-fold pyridoxal phosphate-dependent enzyme [Thiobacillus sp.]